MSRTSRPITVTLGPYQEKVEKRVASGEFASASEMVRAGLRALEREEAEFDAWARARIEAWEKNPSKTVSSKEAFERLFARHEALAKKDAEEV